MFTKRGQGMPLSVIITAVIVVVVALVLILVTTDFGKKLIGLGQATPSALEAATQGCIIAAQNNLVTDYCYNFRKVGNVAVHTENPVDHDQFNPVGFTLLQDCFKRMHIIVTKLEHLGK